MNIFLEMSWHILLTKKVIFLRMTLTTFMIFRPEDVRMRYFLPRKQLFDANCNYYSIPEVYFGAQSQSHLLDLGALLLS